MPRVQVNGVELSYRDSGGEGTPVVLIHGFPFDSELWDPQFEALGKRFRLVAPDLRGFGNSSLPAPASYSMQSFAGDVKTLLDHLGVESAVLGGLSMGGYIAFEFLRAHPENVMALILADTRADSDSPEVRARRIAQQEQVRESGSERLVEPMIQAILSERTRTERPDVVKALTAVMEQDDASWIGGLEAMKNRPDSREDLALIEVPTLVVVGEHDRISPPDVARALQERMAHARLVVIEGAGHISNLESPDAFNSAVEAFLGEL